MRYITYELRKIAGIRYIWIFAAILLLANITLALYTANQKAEQQIPSNIVADFFSTYLVEPEQIETDYTDLLKLSEERNLLFSEAMRRHEFDYEPESLPNKYTVSEKYNDMMLFGEIFGRKNYILEYPFVIQGIINRAYANIAELDFMGVSSDSYGYQYQHEIIYRYNITQSNVKMGLEYTRGWGDYFNYDILNIFIFAILIMVGAAIFAQEKNSGFFSIMHTTKNGRSKTAFAKIGAILILTFAIVIIFTFSTMAVFGAVLGFSNPNNAIQVFDDFILCPAVITVGQYFVITIAFKFLVFSLFSCIIMTISIFISNYAIIYICGFGLFGLNFLLYSTRYLNADNVFKNLNLVAVSAVNPLFVRYRSLNFFGNLIEYIPFMIIAFGTLLFIIAAITIVMFSKGQSRTIGGCFIANTKILNKIKSLLVNIIEKISAVFSKKQTYSLSIFTAEIYKTLIIKRYIFIVIGILIVKCYISNGEFTTLNSYSDAVYKEYMTTLQGKLTNEKLEFISTEREFIDNILITQDEMLTKYLLEDINFNEYREYLKDYNYAHSRNEIFAVIENHLYYIEQTKNQKNIEAWFIYDTGWEKLFHSGFDIVLYSLILLLFAGIFADEYTEKSSSSSFAHILRTTKNGRKLTYFSKLMSALTIAALLTIIFNLVDFILIFKNYDLPAKTAPLVSLQSFAAIDSSITIMQYFIIYTLIKLFANLLFTTFVCVLSELLKKAIPVMSVSIAVTLFPALFVYFGFEIFNYVDFTGFLSATQMYLLSARTNLFGNMGFCTLFVLCCVIISCVLIYKSEKNYVK
jgi:hypothetical protein